MPLPALRLTVSACPFMVPSIVPEVVGFVRISPCAGSAIGSDTGHDTAHVDSAAYNDVAVRAVGGVRVREVHDRGARFRQGAVAVVE